MTITNKTTLSISIHKNITMLSEYFSASSNLKVRKCRIRDKVKRDTAILYLDGITNTQKIEDNVITPLLKMMRFESMEAVSTEHISAADVTIETSIDNLVSELTKGKCIVLIDGYSEGIVADVADWQARTIMEPDTQRTLKGSLIGFNEQLKTNINLIQNQIQTSDLKIESYQIGKRSKTDVALFYMDGLVDESVLQEIKSKLMNIDVKYLIEARVIVDAIEEKKTLFPLVFTCERIDTTVSSLYEGRVAIMVNGVPYTLIVPSLFVDYFQHPDDYHSKAGRFGYRFIRFIGWIMGLLLPGLYVAFAKYHSSWMPDEFRKKLLAGHDTLFPYVLEVLFLLFIFHLLLDASVRIPKTTIILISLIGAITIGETSVAAKLVLPLTLIVVGVNFLTSITIATGGLWGSLNLLRTLFVFIGNFVGMTGILIGFAIIVIYMASLKSVGVPYLAPFIPLNLREMKDVLIRGDLRKLINSKHTYPHKQNKSK